MIRRTFVLLALLLFDTAAFAQVDTAWVRRYNGPGNQSDWANALVVDDSGNVYVCGYSWGVGSSADYAVIKYHPNGDTAWVRRYNGPGYGWDEATALAVDAAGDVYVTGNSVQSSTYPYNQDYATVKYSADGEEVWIERYDGPGNSDDYAYSVALDSLGNVYVAGSANVGGTNLDYVTIKYLPGGDTAWVKQYNGTGNGHDYCYAVATDYLGNTFVTGASLSAGTSYDCVTIGYDSSGHQLWVRRYGGLGEDRARAIAVDNEGNVYITGYSAGSGTYSDCLTIRYRASGDTAWVRTHNGSANDWDECTAIVVDGSDNVHVTGFSHGFGTYRDYVTIKYDSTGEELWASYYNGPGNSTDEASSVAVDDLDNVYVTGFSSDSVTYTDYATLKYSPSGTELWIRRFNGPGSGSDEASAVAVDDSHSVYVTGYSWGDGTAGDYATIKYVQTHFLRGDANGDEVINVADVVYLVNFLYRGGDPPHPIDAGDANCDGIVNVADVVYLVNYLYRGGDPPGCP
ncbi:MAG: SBBP repeat-containing protein [Candidatus Zixiibacteriota bacterium]